MKKIYAILCSITLSTLAFTANAQSESEEKKYSNDVGFNTTFLFTGILNAGSTPFTLMYKKYKDNNNPLRLGINTRINITSNNKSGISAYQNSSFVKLSAVLGKEFQKAINPDWIWYFGGDIIPTFDINYVEQYINGDHTYTSSSKNVGIGFMPFLGVRFNINERLYLSTEFSVGPRYSYNWSVDKRENPEIIDYNVKGGNFNFSMNPAYGLFMYYRF